MPRQRRSKAHLHLCLCRSGGAIDTQRPRRVAFSVSDGSSTRDASAELPQRVFTGKGGRDGGGFKGGLAAEIAEAATRAENEGDGGEVFCEPDAGKGSVAEWAEETEGGFLGWVEGGCGGCRGGKDGWELGIGGDNGAFRGLVVLWWGIAGIVVVFPVSGKGGFAIFRARGGLVCAVESNNRLRGGGGDADDGDGEEPGGLGWERGRGCARGGRGGWPGGEGGGEEGVGS